MKHAKKIASLLLALVMVLALTATAFATGETGSITVDNPKEGTTYTAYKIFDVVYDTKTESGTTIAGDHYAYTIKSSDPWFNDVLTYMGGGTNQVTPNAATGVYTGKGITLTPSATDNTVFVAEFVTEGDGKFSAPAFAKFLNTKKASKTDGKDLIGDTNSVSVNNLPLGYYFVTSSTGALCNLTTTDPNATIHDKNDVPFEKTDDKDSVEIGETVNYKIMGKVPDTTGFGAFDYVITDKMSEGLTLDKGNIKVYISDDDELVTAAAGDKIVDAVLEDKYYTKTTENAKSFDGNADVDFNIRFEVKAMNEADPSLVGKYIFITYTAKVNEKAVAVISNNQATLTYSNDPTDNTQHGTQTKEQTVYSSKISILKVDAADETKKLAGATFVLYKNVEADGTTTKQYYQYDETAKNVSWVTDKAQATPYNTNADGAATIKGLKDGTYYLEETVAPAGYNLLTAAKEITIKGTGDGDTTPVVDNLTHNEKVGNNAGTLLPSTGGMGTTIFYVLGSTLLLGAAVLLITKKRMSAAQ